MAGAFHGSLTALFVETNSFKSASEEDKKRLRENIYLAEQLGAKAETVYGEDIALQIAEYAKLSGASKIVLGRSNTQKRYFISRQTFSERLTELVPNLDIYIIPDKPGQKHRKFPTRSAENSFSPILGHLLNNNPVLSLEIFHRFVEIRIFVLDADEHIAERLLVDASCGSA